MTASPTARTPMASSPALSTQVALAGVSNALAASFTNPIDVVKVRLQMDGEGAARGVRQQYAGVVDAFGQTMSREGVSGLYRGLMASLLREMSYSGIRMGLYEPTKQLLGATDSANTSLGLKVASGAITGCFGSALANPLDLIKVRMQAATAEPPFSSVPAALAAIRREGDGIRGLWRGTGPTCARATLLTASQVPAYDHVKHLMLDGGYLREGYFCHFFCSMVAGVVAAAVTSPADLVKSRVMVQPIDPITGRGALYTSSLDCLLKVVRTEGPLALFKGFHGQWLRIGPHTTISLMAFEQLRHFAGMAYL